MKYWPDAPADLNWNYEIDNKVSINMTEDSNIDYYQAPMVLEGGNIHQDGNGTIYTTEECLLNPNRNPNLTKEQIEEYLKQYLNAEKVIWIPRGVYNDPANNIENLIHIVEPGHVILTWTDDKNDPQYQRSLEALTFLENNTDAWGRKIKVTKLHQPSPLFVTKEEAESWDKNSRFGSRIEGSCLEASYINFYILNHAIIVPSFNDAVWDQNAVSVLQKCFTNYEIIPIYARELVLGGGNVNGITLQEL